MTYVVANRVPIAEDYADKFEESFRNRDGKVEGQPGFIRMEILKPINPDEYYIVLTHWRSKEDFMAWMKSEDFRRAHANPLPPEACRGKSVIEEHTVIVSTEALSKG